MDVLSLVSEADSTRRSITLLIFALLFVSFALMVLTVWYWKYTSPKRYMAPAVANRNKQVRRRKADAGVPYRKTTRVPTETAKFDEVTAVAERQRPNDG